MRCHKAFILRNDTVVKLNGKVDVVIPIARYRLTPTATRNMSETREVRHGLLTLDTSLR